MKRIVVVMVLLVLAAVGTYSLLQARPIENESLVPDLVFLGEGPQSYTVPEGYNFIVKRQNPFRFEWEPGPAYTATGSRERVWRSSGTRGIPPAVYHEDVVVGPVDPGCVIQYLTIDDDVDDRINTFRLDGNIIHEIPQGMVSEGEFTINSAGTLSYEANDSIGMYLSVCEIELTPTPTATSLATATPVVTATPTSLTPAPTETPDGRPEVTPTATATATRRPRERACARINFEVGGDVARTGTYALQEVGGRTLATWYALDGWESSPWITGLDISFPSVHVQVVYYPTDGSDPITMRIVNPAPDTPYGWLSRGMCHAIEVAWP